MTLRATMPLRCSADHFLGIQVPITIICLYWEGGIPSFGLPSNQSMYVPVEELAKVMDSSGLELRDIVLQKNISIPPTSLLPFPSVPLNGVFHDSDLWSLNILNVFICGICHPLTSCVLFHLRTFYKVILWSGYGKKTQLEFLPSLHWRRKNCMTTVPGTLMCEVE